MRKDTYRDMKKYKAARKRQNKRYYDKTVCGRHRWEHWHDDLVLEHSMTDSQLSKIIGHGVRAIQIRRSRLRRRHGNSNQRAETTDGR